MTATKTRTLTQVALLTALTLVLGKTFQFSMAVGFFTLLDVGIYFTAFYLGKREAALVGGLSGLLIDLISGYPQYMLVSLIAHGAQGYLAGLTGKKQSWGLVLASLVVVASYFLAEVLFYDLPAALATVVGNSLQTLVGLGLGYVLAKLVKQALAK